MEKSFKLNPPLMPNYITYGSGVVKREDSFRQAATIAVQDLTEQEAIEYAELMKQAFIEHWKNKTELKKKFR